jgi:hypothetical protein
MRIGALGLAYPWAMGNLQTCLAAGFLTTRMILASARIILATTRSSSIRKMHSALGMLGARSAYPLSRKRCYPTTDTRLRVWQSSSFIPRERIKRATPVFGDFVRNRKVAAGQPILSRELKHHYVTHCILLEQ